MKNLFFSLYITLLVLFAGTGAAAPAGVKKNAGKCAPVTPKAMWQKQGRKAPASARQSEQTPTDPVKAVPMTERKSKPLRVDAGAARGGARGPREVRSARGGRGADAGRGAQGGGGRGPGRGMGRGHGN